MTYGAYGPGKGVMRTPSTHGVDPRRAASRKVQEPGRVEHTKLIFDMVIGKVPNDKEQVLEALAEQENPAGRAKSAKARAAAQTPERRSEIARKAAAARWRNT